MRDERIRRDSHQNFLRKTLRSVTKSEQCRLSRTQFPWSGHGTPWTMTSFWQPKRLHFMTRASYRSPRNKVNTDLHSTLLLSRQNENKNQYGPITGDFPVKIINREKLRSLIFLPTVLAVNHLCDFINRVTSR